MSHLLITALLFISVVLGLVLGPVLLILWSKKVYKPLVQRMEKRAASIGTLSFNHISVVTLAYMLPGLLIFVACCIPAIYFSHLSKQERVCEEIVRANKGIQKDDPFLQQRCGALDIDEIFGTAAR